VLDIKAIQDKLKEINETDPESLIKVDSSEA